MRKDKEVPKFKTEDEERDFWAKNDSSIYMDWSKAQKNPVFSNLCKSNTELKY